jgi:hypothetical protein
VSIEKLLVGLAERGVEPYLRDGRLRVRAPQGALTDDLRATLVARKAELVALLTPAPPPVRGICRSCGKPTRIRGSGALLPPGYRVAWCDTPDCGTAEVVAVGGGEGAA